MHNSSKWLVLPLLAMVVIFLAACAAPSAIPIVERKQPPTERIYTHWVSKGETLYAIAWRYNMDVIDLAGANGLSQSYKIRAGQKLNLDLSRIPKRTAITQVAKKTNSSRSIKSKQQRLSAWFWPTKGRILKQFSWQTKKSGQFGHKGMDIAGRLGQPVIAAQKGVVVYAGSGLPAYGKLLIVKHDDIYLSAYAHNSRLLVVEGDSVRTGQKIAEVGSTGTNLNHLHFEIRKHGKPVNPMRLLPNL